MEQVPFSRIGVAIHLFGSAGGFLEVTVEVFQWGRMPHFP
jgi:hypothetical protein